MPKVAQLHFCFRAIAILAMGWMVASCNATKGVPKGRQLLVKNEIVVNGKDVSESGAMATIRQKPNRSITIPLVDWVLWRPYLGIYNLGDTSKAKGFKHWLTKIGEPPVLVDSIETERSATQIGRYYYNRGLFLNEVEVIVEPENRRGNKAKVTYHVYTGPQYYFHNLEFIISSPGIEGVVRQVRSESKIKAGMPFNTQQLDQERDRLVKTLRDNGYYGFPKSLVRIEADTSVGDRNVRLKLFVGDLPVAIGDTLFYVEHKPYTIKNIFIDPNYNFRTGALKGSDTTQFLQLKITHHPEGIFFKPYFIESLVHFKPGDLYSEQVARDSYAHFANSRIFQSTEISYSVIEGDTTNGLNAVIRAQPFKRNSFSTEVEFTTTAGNYGTAGFITWSRKNIFKAGEIFDISLRGALEAQLVLSGENNTLFNTREIGVETGINFPRFLLFNSINSRIPKRMNPRSRVFTSFNYQTRVEFERIIFKVGLLYTWKESSTKFHQINLLDVSYVYLPRIDQDYLNSLEFKASFQNNLIMDVRYTFMYDNLPVRKGRTHQFFRGSIEPAGNLLSTVNGPGRFAFNEDLQQYTLFGVPYAQYVRLDGDFRHFIDITAENQVAMRFFAGSTITYGNTPFMPPFEKSFMAGGSNDMRGWTAFRLGPGNFPNQLYNAGTTSYASVAPIKLMANLEYRFPLIQSLRGALFFDAGNIWLWNRALDTTNFTELELALINEGTFFWNRFYKQIAVNTGLGVRYDLGFFAIRVDAGIRIFDPSEAEGERFVLPGLPWNIFNLNFALGYPF